MNENGEKGGFHLHKYTTKLGDIWDVIAKNEMGDERFMAVLMRANPSYIFVDRFSAGVELNVPDVTKSMIVNLPPWRR